MITTGRDGTGRDGTGRDKYIVVSVKDDGVGMSAEKIEQLFKLNTQVSTLGTANEKGSGIGLILCKEFINKHKCDIWVESEPDKGTTFNFTLLKAGGRDSI